MDTWLKGSGADLAIGRNRPTVIIGNGIDPLKRTDLVGALRCLNVVPIVELARSQVQAGAGIIKVGVKAEGVDESKVLPIAVRAVAESVPVPICIDTDEPEALAAALEVCPGKPLVNAISIREHSLKEMLPLAKKRGAAVIALAEDDQGIPEDLDARIEMTRQALRMCITAGVPREDVILDPVVLSVHAVPSAARDALQAVVYLARIDQINLTLNIQNVSLGLPGSDVIDELFAAMATFAGVTSVVVDPLRGRRASLVSDLLLGRDGSVKRYLESR